MINQNKNQIKLFILFYYFLCSIGLICFSYFLSRLSIAHLILPKIEAVSFSRWAEPNIKTTERILNYISACAFLFIYYTLLYYFLKKYEEIKAKNKSVNKNVYSKNVFYFLLSIAALTNLAIVYLAKTKPSFSTIYIFIVWLAVLFLPFLVNIISKAKDMLFSLKKIYENKVVLYFFFFLFLLVLMQNVMIFSNYLYPKKLFVSNDYLNIPGQTIINNNIYDNIEFINAHKIANLNLYNPLKSKYQSSLAEQLNKGIKTNKSYLVNLITQNQPEKFFYNNETNKLQITGKLNLLDYIAITDIASNKNEINKLYPLDQKKISPQKTYNSQEKKFIQINLPEWINMAAAGHYFHHQNAMYGPINELYLGKPKSDINFLYGYLNSLVLEKILKIGNNFSFQSYTAFLYSFYPIYSFFFIIIAYVIFRNFNYVYLAAICSLCAYLQIGFEDLRFAPGFNPSRHFFDIFVLLSFYLYLFAKKKNHFFLILSFFFCFLSLLTAKEFGLVLFVSLILCQFFSVISYSKKYHDIFFSLIYGCVIFLIFSIFKTGKNELFLYSLTGVSVPTISFTIISMIFISLSLVYIYLIYSNTDDVRFRLLFLFSFFYVQGELVYYIWYPTTNHFFSLGCSITIMILFFIRQLKLNYETKNNLIFTLMLFITIFIYIPFNIKYYVDQNKYFAIQRNHTVYSWEFARARFLSDMNPEPFKSAVSLIKKYSENSKKIYIISRYDNFLPFLAEKYSAMPFIEMQTSLVSKKEMNLSTALLLKDRPEYLFVDTDFNYNFNYSIFDKNDPISQNSQDILHKLSLGRVLVIKNLMNLFSNIASNYQLVERSGLISVYQLKQPNRTTTKATI